MKKILLAAALLIGTNGIAQNYFIIDKSVGTVAPYSMNDASATAILTGVTGGMTNTLSTTQSFPFSGWRFYDTVVTQFKVSSSGYLTFNVAQTADVTTNTTLPSTSAPKSAIFAFWDNLMLSPVTQGANTFPSDVKSFIYGTAPNRVFVVQWRLAQLGSTSNVTYFAIRFYEQGNFDIVENYGFGTFSATVGTNNADGTIGYNLPASPNMNFGGKNGSYDATLSDVYRFTYGNQPDVLLQIKQNNTAPLVSLTSPISTIKVKVANYGKISTSLAKFNYSVDNGPTKSQMLSPFVVNSDGQDIVEAVHPMTYTAVLADAGTYKNVKAWFTDININKGNSDTISFQIFVNKGITGTKRVLIEEASGGWCGFCPDGHIKMRDILEANYNVGGTIYKAIGVVHHNSDGMAHTKSDTINAAGFLTGYPSAFIDRTKFSDVATVATSNRGIWGQKVADQAATPTPCNVSIINKSFNAVTRQISFDVKVDFVDYALPGDLRITAFIVEDKVRGPLISTTNTQWNQHNYYSMNDAGAGGASHELYTQPAYFYGYMHRHVVRAILPSAWGVAGDIATSPAQGGSYTKNFTYSLPAMVSMNSATDYPGFQNIYTEFQNTFSGPAQNKPTDVSIVALVSYYDTDIKKRMVINANKAPLMWASSVKENTNNSISSNVYPNPANGITRIDFNMMQTDNVNIEVYNLVGQKVMDIKNGGFATGEHSVYFNANDLSNGVYIININTANGGKSSNKIVVAN